MASIVRRLQACLRLVPAVPGWEGVLPLCPQQERSDFLFRRSRFFFTTGQPTFTLETQPRCRRDHRQMSYMECTQPPSLGVSAIGAHPMLDSRYSSRFQSREAGTKDPPPQASRFVAPSVMKPLRRRLLFRACHHGIPPVWWKGDNMPHATRDGRPVHPYTDLCPEHAGFLVYDFLRTLALPRDSLSDRARLRRLVLLGQERTHQCRHQCGRAPAAGVDQSGSVPTTPAAASCTSSSEIEREE